MNQDITRRTNVSPLAHSALDVSITDLVAQYELTHSFRNTGDKAMEAVYSFPLPLDAAFMGMEAHLAGEHLLAEVRPQAQATRQYDDAIADGDSAVLLERLEPGMLCVSLGNLKPGEVGDITLRFAAPLQCADGAARFVLPLVHRPRYGRSQLDELSEPRHDFAAEHPLQATIQVRGLLAHAPVSCATHAARFASTDDGQELRLNQAMLDRDVVLVFDLPTDFSGQARLVRDGDDAIGVLSFTIPAELAVSGPFDLCLVMDGSGSMSGDAIAQSRAALLAVADELSDDDCVQVLRFGSDTVPLFRRPLKATERVREAMRELVGTIDANLGGTEMGEALDQAIDMLVGRGEAEGRRRAIILVTDGAVQPDVIQHAQKLARKHAVSIFVVAVGSSAGADVLAPLAQATAAVLERAVPAEPIDAAVMRQLRRARADKPVGVHIRWRTCDAQPLQLDTAYAGDAVTAMAMLPGANTLEAEVRLVGCNETQTFALTQAEAAPALRALAGQAAYHQATRRQQPALALRYGLITDDTAAVLVKHRSAADQVVGLPVVSPISHMYPGGMMGCVLMEESNMARCCNALMVPPVFSRRRIVEEMEAYLMAVPLHDLGDVGSLADNEADAALPPSLLRALVALLLDANATDITLEQILGQLDPSLHEPARNLLAEACPDGLDLESAIELLQQLLEDMPDTKLSDDQEARLAVIVQIEEAESD